MGRQFLNDDCVEMVKCDWKNMQGTIGLEGIIQSEPSLSIRVFCFK